MSDIVERLRHAHPSSQQYAAGSMILSEAADEIERLRAENKSMEDHIHHIGIMYAEQADQLKALREALKNHAEEAAKMVSAEPVANVVNGKLLSHKDNGIPDGPLYTSPAIPAGWYTLDQIADACMQAEIPDSKFESIAIVLAAAPKPGQ